MKNEKDPQDVLRKVVNLIEDDVDHIIKNGKTNFDLETGEMLVKFLGALPRAIKALEGKDDEDELKSWSSLSKKDLKKKALEIIDAIDE